MINDQSISVRLESPLVRVFLFAPCLSYVCFVFFRFLVDDPFLYGLITVLNIGYGLILLYLFFYIVGYEARTLLFLFIAFFSSFLSLAVINNDIYLSTIFMLCNMGYGASIMFTRERIGGFSKVFWSFLLIFFVFILSGGIAEDFFRVSRNFISTFIVLLVSIYFILLSKDAKNPSFLLVFLSVLVCFWAEGRAGVLVILGVFFGAALIYDDFRYKCLLVVLAVVFCVYFFGFLDYFIYLYKSSFERFDRLGLESVRVFINEEYIGFAFSRLDYFFFGVFVDEIDLIASLGGNSHNSYLNLHINYGLLGFLWIIAHILISIGFLLKRRIYSVFLVVLAVLVRSFFDVTAFYGPLDPIVYFSVILMFLYKVKKNSFK